MFKKSILKKKVTPKAKTYKNGYTKKGNQITCYVNGYKYVVYDGGDETSEGTKLYCNIIDKSNKLIGKTTAIGMSNGTIKLKTKKGTFLLTKFK